MMRQLGGSWYRIITTYNTILAKTSCRFDPNLDGSSFEVQQRIMLLQKALWLRVYS
jgi:hypothetical protein